MIHEMGRGVDMQKSRRYQFAPRLGPYRTAVVLVVAIALGGCAKESSGTLKERAQQYLDLKQGKRWEEVYDGYLDPTLKRTLTKEAFLNKRALAFDVLRHEIKDIKENGSEGSVLVAGEANFPARGTGGNVHMLQRDFSSTDQWVKRDEVWYIVLTE